MWDFGFQVRYFENIFLSGIQVISVQTGAGVDTGDLDEDGVAELFGKTAGFKADEPNVTPSEEVAPDDDF